MRIPLDHQSDLPLYKQIEKYIRDAILSGNLAADTQLPPTRKLAAGLGISRITVQNAYMELESDGLIASREGSGTIVLPLVSDLLSQQSGEHPEWPLWQLEFSTDEIHEENKIIKRLNPNEMISFTGVGDPREYPIREFRKAVQDVLRQEGSLALAYGDFQGGYAPLRKTITQLLASQGIRAHADSVIVTSGSQQALALICQVLLKPGDVVLVESPTYNMALEYFKTMQYKVISVPMDIHGMCVDQLEAILQQYHPRLIYTIPNFQNPSGVCLSSSRRRTLVALAERYNVPICEDDYVGDLRYDGRSKPALKALDPGGRVLYIGSFSKMLMPGLRVGYLVAEGPVFAHLQTHKKGNDLTTSPFIQRVLYEFVNVGRYQAHIRRSCRMYRKRRDAIVQAIRQYFGRELDFNLPHGGLFVWLHLPAGISSDQLLVQAVREGVEFAPGARFFLEKNQGNAFLRLNFASLTEEEIGLGIRRLHAAYLKMNQHRKIRP